MRHLFHLGLFIVALTAVTQAQAQGRGRAVGHERAPGYQRVARAEPGAVAWQGYRPWTDADRDFDEIVSITAQWNQSVASYDRRGQWIADRRLNAWLRAELGESRRRPYDQRYETRLRNLNARLVLLERQHSSGFRGYYPRKARLLDELVKLAAWEAQRARGHHRGPIRPSFAIR